MNSMRIKYGSLQDHAEFSTCSVQVPYEALDAQYGSDLINTLDVIPASNIRIYIPHYEVNPPTWPGQGLGCSDEG